MELNTAVISALVSIATTVSIVSYGYGRLQQKIADLKTKVAALEGKCLKLEVTTQSHETWQRVTDAKLDEKFQKVFEVLSDIKETLKDHAETFRGRSARSGL